MEYQVFLANVKERLKEELHGQVRVEDYRTLKNNGEERQGFVFQTEKEGISPVIYMEEYYERYLHGMEMERVIDSLINWYEHARQIPDPVMEAEHLRDFERIRKKDRLSDYQHREKSEDFDPGAASAISGFERRILCAVFRAKVQRYLNADYKRTFITLGDCKGRDHSGCQVEHTAFASGGDCGCSEFGFGNVSGIRKE